MGTIFYQWVKEYQWIMQWRESVKWQIERITKDLNSIATSNQSVEELPKLSAMPPPLGIPNAKPNRPPVAIVEKDVHETARDDMAARLEIIGVLNIVLSESTSWQTIIKMIFTVLTTFFGIRLINHGFRKL